MILGGGIFGGSACFLAFVGAGLSRGATSGRGLASGVSLSTRAASIFFFVGGAAAAPRGVFCFQVEGRKLLFEKIELFDKLFVLSLSLFADKFLELLAVGRGFVVDFHLGIFGGFFGEVRRGKFLQFQVDGESFGCVLVDFPGAEKSCIEGTVKFVDFLVGVALLCWRGGTGLS